MHLNLPTLLDVAIGLVFIFFVFSIFVSGIVELINSFMEERANLLRLALNKLLGTPLANAFYAHHLTEVKQQKRWLFTKPINYLSADSFSTVLIDLLKKAELNAGLVNGTQAQVGMAQTLAAIEQSLQDPTLVNVKELIEPMLAKSDSFQSFKEALEKWYNGYMEQVSGWYKRYAQGVAWIVSAVVVLAFNVDTIHLTNRLFNDNGLRERLVAEAISTTKSGPTAYGKDTNFVNYLAKNQPSLLDTTKKAIIDPLADSDKFMVQSAYVQFVQGRIEELQLPVSWRWINGGLALQPGQNRYIALLGWVLTTAALSFGAPFWFDLLLKLVNIRNTARRPPGNPDPTK